MSRSAALISELIASTSQSTSRAMAVVIDDISMTPNISRGFPPERETPIFAKVFWGSLRTKIIFLAPIGLALHALAPNAITPLLGLGGLYLAYEGACGFLERFTDVEVEAAAPEEDAGLDDKAREKARVKDVIRMDMVLSAEIMAVSLSALPDEGLALQALSLILTAIFITLVVYGSGLLIVKSDDLGVRLANNEHSPVAREVGRFILKFVPFLLKALSWIGGFAMLWVAGQLMLEALASFGIDHVEHAIERAAETTRDSLRFGGGFFGELLRGIFDGIFGLVIGLAVFALVRFLFAPLSRALHMK